MNRTQRTYLETIARRAMNAKLEAPRYTSLYQVSEAIKSELRAAGCSDRQVLKIAKRVLTKDVTYI